MEEAYAAVITEDGHLHVIMWPLHTQDTEDIDEFERQVHEHFGSGAVWGFIEDNRVRLGWH